MPPTRGQGSLSRGGRAQPKGGRTRAAGLRMARARGGAPRLLGCSAPRASALIPISATYQQPHPTRQAAGKPKTAPAEEKNGDHGGGLLTAATAPQRGTGRQAADRPRGRDRSPKARLGPQPCRLGRGPHLFGEGKGPRSKKMRAGGAMRGGGPRFARACGAGVPAGPARAKSEGSGPQGRIYTPAKLTKSARARGMRAPAP